MQKVLNGSADCSVLPWDDETWRIIAGWVENSGYGIVQKVVLLPAPSDVVFGRGQCESAAAR